MQNPYIKDFAHSLQSKMLQILFLRTKVCRIWKGMVNEMIENNMLEQWKEMICKYVEVDSDSITEDSRFIEDLGFTSFDFMSLIGEAEEKFDIEVEEREAADITTVGEAVRYVTSLME